MKNEKSSLQRSLDFLRHEVWEIELSTVSGLRRWGTWLIRIIHLILKGFREDHLSIHAAALTFSTLMSLVPLLAIAFSVLKGLGAGDEAERRLLEATAVPIQSFVQQILGIVDKTNFVALGWVGVAVLFFTVVQVLGSIERSFNQVWGVTKARNFWRRFANYTSITVVVPVLLMAAFAISATLSNEHLIQKMGEAAVLYRELLHFTPWFAVWFAFFILFVFMPNTRVERGVAAWGALIAAILWLIWQKIYIHLQVNLAGYNAIYGTFASVPIFLLWLYVGWGIILFGAEVTFAFQNHDTYHMEQMANKASARSKISLALSTVLAAARAFESGCTKFDVALYAHEQRVPIRLVNDVVNVLVKGGYLAQIAEEATAYVLLKPADKINVSDVIDLMIRQGAAPQTVGVSKIDPAVEAIMNDFDNGLRQALAQKTFSELIDKKRSS